jgi:hypothetical protein
MVALSDMVWIKILWEHTWITRETIGTPRGRRHATVQVTLRGTQIHMDDPVAMTTTQGIGVVIAKDPVNPLELDSGLTLASSHYKRIMQS